VSVNFPNNPTGAVPDPETWQRLVRLCDERGVLLFSDEVYRGLEHDCTDRLPAACERYERALSLGAVSKAHGLPGLRIGWLACRDPALLERIRSLKLYTTICSSAPSELLVALALRHAEELVARSRRLLLANLPLVDAFLERRDELFEWVRPNAGPIGFPRLSGERDVQAWCEEIAEQAGVLLLPGTVYGQPTQVRIGFGRANLPHALERLDEHLG
jgi:aspartate/methionine/tyrosine aminotransferase